MAENWEQYALCADTSVDFFSDDPLETEMAQSICHDCPVRKTCLTEALSNEHRFGVWGGASEITIRRALNIDQYGKPIAKPTRDINCPACYSVDITTVETKRASRHLECSACGTGWWSRITSPVVKIDAEVDEDDEDSVEDNLPAGGGL